MLERSRRQHREQDLLREEHLRCMRADEERLHAWRADSEAKLAAAQAAARRQLEQATQAERHAERQQQEGEDRLQARLAEVQQQEQKVARQQAAAEAGLCQMDQLQRQLAGALLEQGSLRQQLSTARLAHQAEQAEMQQERDQLAAAGRAASAVAVASGPGLSPQDSDRLQAAVRRLMERVEGLQVEVEACRQREQLWKSSAAEADRLLAKVSGSALHCRVLCVLQIQTPTMAIYLHVYSLKQCTHPNLSSCAGRQGAGPGPAAWRGAAPGAGCRCARGDRPPGAGSPGGSRRGGAPGSLTASCEPGCAAVAGWCRG